MMFLLEFVSLPKNETGSRSSDSTASDPGRPFVFPVHRHRPTWGHPLPLEDPPGVNLDVFPSVPVEN